MHVGMFALASSSHLSSLSSSLLTSPSHSDVTLVTPSLSLQAHKALLLSRLPSLSSLICPSCSPHSPLLLLLPDTQAYSLTSALEELYTTGQAKQLEDILGLKGEAGAEAKKQHKEGGEEDGLGEGRGAGLICQRTVNEDDKMEEKSWQEEDVKDSYRDKNESDPNFAIIPCDIEGTFKSFKKKSFRLNGRRKIRSNLNRPGSDHHRIINPENTWDITRKQSPLVFRSTLSVSKNGEKRRFFHSLANNCYRYDRRNIQSDGRAYFVCSVQGCRAVVKADYTSKQTADKEEPKVFLPSLLTNSCHVLEDGRLHPIQAGIVCVIVIVIVICIVIIVNVIFIILSSSSPSLLQLGLSSYFYFVIMIILCRLV